MKLLVTGGAGYIGSVLVRKLVGFGHNVVVFDNQSTGNEHSISLIESVRFIDGDLSNPNDLKKLGPFIDFDAVIHLAKSHDVLESLVKPYDYFINNLNSTLNLLEFMREKRIKKLVFAGSSHLYGESKEDLVHEYDFLNIRTPFAESESACEKFLGWYDYVHGIKAVSLRIFEVAGAMESGSAGEHRRNMGMVSQFVRSAVSEGVIRIPGEDFDTFDGTFERDFVHVEDVASAFILSLDFLSKNKRSEIFNICTGKKTSLKSVAYEIESQLEKDIKKIVSERRVCDVASLAGDNTKAAEILGWNPSHSFSSIVQTAIYWYIKHPRGFDDFV